MAASSDIAVAGAGPAGLALAVLLARQGRRVTVYERFDTPQPVGAGFMLQPTGLAVLDRMGLTAEVEALAQPIDHLFGRAHPSGRVVLDVRYADLARPRAALGVHRAALFHVLHRAAMQAGVAFETGWPVRDVSDGRLTCEDGRTSAAYDLVVDAMGARSPVAQRLLAAAGRRRLDLAFGALWATTPWPDDPHFEPRALQQVYRRADTMIGVLPVGRRPGDEVPLATFFWSLKHADHPRWRAEGLDAWKAQVLSFWPETATVLDTLNDPDQLILARYGHHTLPRPAEVKLAVIGDAAHSTSPQLGQGVNMGLLDAFALAEALTIHADLDQALGAYTAARRLHVRLYQALSLVFTPFYQADGRVLPMARDHILGPVSRLPGAARLLAATVSGLLLDPRPEPERV